MAKLKIVIAGAPVLREVAQTVERIDKKLQRLLRDIDYSIVQLSKLKSWDVYNYN